MIRVFLTMVLVAVVAAKVPYIKTKDEIQAFRELLDQKPSAARARFNAARYPLANPNENSGLFQGDILLTDDQKEDLVERFATGSRNGVIGNHRLWPNKTVVYDIDESFFHDRHIHAIETAINEFRRVSCVNFRKRTPSDINYVLITGHQNGCYANVGFYNGYGVHTLNLGVAEPPFGCFSLGVILHEFQHTLGFWHMHSTYNRDDWVEIVWDNIPLGSQHNFNIYDSNTVSNYGVDYDYGSLQHYSLYAFSNNGQRTIIPKKDYDGIIGQQFGQSDHDILKLNRLYQCPGFESW